MEKADQIWNNALGSKPASKLPGDVALHMALVVHGLVQNGGVLHAVEGLNATDLEAGKSGYVWLGLADVASLISEIEVRAVTNESADGDLGALEEEANSRYAAAVPDDEAIEVAFCDRLAKGPEAFADPHQRRGWRRLIKI